MLNELKRLTCVRQTQSEPHRAVCQRGGTVKEIARTFALLAFQLCGLCTLCGWMNPCSSAVAFYRLSSSRIVPDSIANFSENQICLCQRCVLRRSPVRAVRLKLLNAKSPS